MSWSTHARERFTANRSGTIGAVVLIAAVVAWVVWMTGFIG